MTYIRRMYFIWFHFRSFAGWIGNIIWGVVDWFKQILDAVSDVVRLFVIGKESIIRNADNPELFGQCLAIRRERGELDSEARKREKNLSKRDQNLLDDCFKDYKY